MYDCMIVLPSSSSAQRALRLLAGNGIPGVTTRPPASIAGSSCAHGIKFDRRFLPQVQGILEESHITRRGVYTLREGKTNQFVP